MKFIIGLRTIFTITGGSMEKEEFGFSVLQPSLFVIGSPAIYYIFIQNDNWLIILHHWLLIIITIPALLFIWRQLRITVLMLLCRPALILTEKAVTITERNYTIRWTDMMDVYIASNISSSTGAVTPQKSYVVLRVRNADDYIKAIKNPFTRYYRWYTRRLWNESPFEINLFLVKGDDDEIYHQVLRYYQNNRGF